MHPTDLCMKTKDCAMRRGHEGDCGGYKTLLKAVAHKQTSRLLHWVLRSLKPPVVR